MNATAKQAIRKVAAVKAAQREETTDARGLVSLFPGLASIEPRVRSLFNGLFVDESNRENSLFPGFVALVQYDAKRAMVEARDARRSLRKDARAIRRAARAERRASRGLASDSSLFNFGFLRVRASKNGRTFRVTFRIDASDPVPATIAGGLGTLVA